MINQIEPWIDDSELTELKRVIDSTFVTEAALTEEFEVMTKELTGSKYAISVTNGTMALFCALKALGIGKNDEVIVPNLTFIASANAVILAGATPVLCDIDPITFCIDINKAEKLCNNKTKAIMPVHLYGQSADMEKCVGLAKSKNIFIVEDAAQGVGVFFNKKHVGTFGDVGILSYYGNKTITCGEGGMILTDNIDIAKTCYRLKNHGRDTKGTFIHDHIGYNFAFTEMQAAVGISQMKKLPKLIAKKNEIKDRYIKGLSSVKGFSPVKIDKRCSPVFWFSSFLVKDAKFLSEKLKEHNIQTRRFFYPMHLQPCYQEVLDSVNNGFPVTEAIYSHGLSLPSSYSLQEADINHIINSIKKIYEENRPRL